MDTELSSILADWLADAIAWLRVPVTPTAIRWEVLSLAILLVTFGSALLQLLIAGLDLTHVLRAGTNGSIKRMARREVRAGLTRLVRVLAWGWLFLAFAGNAPYAVALVAFVPAVYALCELLDGALDARVRAQNQAYFQAVDEEEHRQKVYLRVKRRLGETQETERLTPPSPLPAVPRDDVPCHILPPPEPPATYPHERSDADEPEPDATT